MSSFNLAKNDETWVLVIDKKNSIIPKISPAFKTEIALDVEDALQKLKDPYPKAILTTLDDEIKVSLDLCKALRTHRRISHIPIILVAGHATEKIVNLGINAGATTVVSQSTSSRLLTLRINRLAEVCNYSFAPSEFILKVNAGIADHIEDPDLKVQSLADYMKMNRKTLYRRILRETGYSAQLYIRHIRICRAGHLLCRRGADISEVCFSVGMPDQSYFSKCFKDYFRKSPKDFLDSSRQK